MRPLLLVFARAPRFGMVKRRLARDIGPLAALTFHRATLDRLLREVGRDPRWATALSVTPDTAASGYAPWARHVLRIAQGRGDLGARMRRGLTIGGPVIIVGSDIPAIRRTHIAAAFRALGAADFVLGPAEDGGFWLIGAAGRRPLPRGLFAGVRWSGPHALDDTLATIPHGRRVAFVAPLADVDDGAAWERWRRAGHAQAAPPSD